MTPEETRLRALSATPSTYGASEGVTVSRGDLTALLSEVNRLRTLAEPPWRDADDSYSEAIRAAHPTRLKRHDVYETAMEMVGNRHSKYALVDLTNWLLVEANQHRARAERLAGALVWATASLVAATSLLERGGKRAAPSDKMFAQMLADYHAAAEVARQALAQEGEADER